MNVMHLNVFSCIFVQLLELLLERLLEQILEVSEKLITFTNNLYLY